MPSENLVGFPTYISDFGQWSGQIGRPPTGQPPCSFVGKWEKGEGHRFLPALVTNSWNIHSLFMIHIGLFGLCPKNSDPLPPQELRQPWHFMLSTRPPPPTLGFLRLPVPTSPPFKQSPKESSFISFSLVAKIRELYPEEDGKYMGYKRKAID